MHKNHHHNKRGILLTQSFFIVNQDLGHSPLVLLTSWKTSEESIQAIHPS